ncbi:ribonuclease HI [Trypanosoma cruzi]|nr:ribonuclease HI [Trypanosoma cruzi]
MWFVCPTSVASQCGHFFFRRRVEGRLSTGGASASLVVGGTASVPGAVGSLLERMRAECSGEMLRKRHWLVQSLTVQYRRPQSSDSPHPAHAMFVRSCLSRAS